jgi:hypothetical protein
MLECNNKEIYDVGFVDPYIVNENPKDVEHDLFTFFTEQSLKKENSVSL